MLNNLTNFFNLITGRRIKTQLEPSDLIAIGTKQSPALGDYKPTAIKFSDLQAQVGGLQSVAVDGVTITGDGTLGNPLVASIPSSSVNYANVVFVDLTNGNNSTAVINDFTKPYLTVSAAMAAAAALPIISSINRALVYIRRGTYVNISIVLRDNVDIYCEPGVTFIGSSTIRDSLGAVTSNIYGHMRANVSGGAFFELNNDTGCTFEFDEIVSNAAAVYVRITTHTKRVILKGNYITSNTIGQGWGVGFRYGVNVSVDIKHSINAIHRVIWLRNISGSVTINCPNINLIEGNVYGGTWKQIIFSDGAETGKAVINGNLVNRDIVDYGATTAGIWNVSNIRLKYTGDINTGVIKAIDLNSVSSGVTEINGNMSSENLYTGWIYGGGQVIIKNAVIINRNASVNPSYVLSFNGTLNCFLKDCYITSSKTNSDVIHMNTATSNLVIDGCQIYSPGVLGSSIVSGVGPANVRVNNTRVNKAPSVDITDVYTPTGIIVDPQVINPSLIV